MNVDPRNIVNGREIPSHLYADQPYIVRTDDGAWVSVMTTGEGREGAPGQFVITQRSIDQGKTWTDEARLEESGAPENSWGVLLKAPSGRIFCFYVYNGENHRRIIADPGSPAYPDGYCTRVDSIGSYVFRFSDDHGRTWSGRRITIPVREFEIDRKNTHHGAIRFFWNVGKPFVDQATAYVPLHKVGGFGSGFFTSSEGALVASGDLLTVNDPSAATWETLPEGDTGIRAPEGHGPIAEEHSFAVLSDGSFFVVYRTISGYSACSYSRDKGRTWSPPDRMRHADGRPIKHPRAANFVWKCSNGKYLYWFHNNGGAYVQRMQDVDASFPYTNRNPVWLSGGVEADSPEGRVVQWSEPEIILYDDDPLVRMSYPDLIEEDGRLFVSETQKESARVHELDMEIVSGLWGQFDRDTKKPETADFTLSEFGQIRDRPLLPILPPLTARDSVRGDYGTKDLRSGFSLDFDIHIEECCDGATILDNRDSGGRGIALRRTTDSDFEFLMSDGQYRVAAPIYTGVAMGNGPFRLTILVDGGPKTISTVCNGIFVDGGENTQFGWTRYSRYLSDVSSVEPLCTSVSGCRLRRLSVYFRCLSVSEAIGLQRN